MRQVLETDWKKLAPRGEVNGSEHRHLRVLVSLLPR